MCVSFYKQPNSTSNKKEAYIVVRTMNVCFFINKYEYGFSFGVINVLLNI